MIMMPAQKLSEIVPRIEAAGDRLALEACVAEGLAAFGISPEAMRQADRAARFDADRLAYADIILAIARIRALSFPAHAPDEATRLREAGLTGRQREVLDWAAAGKSNGDIATILGQSRRAIDYHMSEILRKLRVTSRAQAIACAFRH